MFSKLQANHKTIWHNGGMNDNLLNNEVIIQKYTQHLPLISFITYSSYLDGLLTILLNEFVLHLLFLQLHYIDYLLFG